MGKGAVDLWHKLGPRLEADPAAKAAVENYIQRHPERAMDAYVIDDQLGKIVAVTRYTKPIVGWTDRSEE